MNNNNNEKISIKRKFCDDFVRYGFTSIISAGIEKPQCVESMKPNKLKHHFDTKHLSFASKDTGYFKRKTKDIKRSRLDTGGKYHQQNRATFKVLYMVALRIPKAKKPHTISKKLLLPATKDIVRVMIGN